MYTEKNIAYENSTHWVLDDPTKKFFEVYKTGATHSTRCAQIGRGLQDALNRAIAEADRRSAMEGVQAPQNDCDGEVVRCQQLRA